MNFKHYPLLGLALGAALVSGQAFAQATATAKLDVHGTVVPTSCTPTLSEPSVDYGTINPQSLSKTAVTNLGLKTVALQVRCSTSGPVALRVSDGRPGTVATSVAGTIDAGTNDTHAFGLGTIANDGDEEKIGAYTLRFTQPFADGFTKYLVLSNDGGAWGNEVLSALMAPDVDRRVAWTARPGSVGSYTNSTVQVEIRTGIAPSNTLTLDSEVTLNGEAVIELVYL